MKIQIQFEDRTEPERVEIHEVTIYDGWLFWPVALALGTLGLLAGWLAIH